MLFMWEKVAARPDEGVYVARAILRLSPTRKHCGRGGKLLFGDMMRTLTGLNALLQGCQLLLKPGIKRFVILPLLINLLLFASLLWTSAHYLAQFNHWLSTHLPSWLGWATAIIWILFFLSFFMILLYTFTTIANILSAPFNGLLAEKVEWYLTGHAPPTLTGWALIKDTPRIICRQLRILGYYLPRAILLFVLFFIPIIQVIAPILWFLFHAGFMALQYSDYPADNHRISFRELLRHLKQQRLDSLSFGTGVLILTMMPVINFIAMPAAVAGATALWVRRVN
jgi:CysZ protein